MTAVDDVLSRLSVASFRGIEVPILTSNTGFQQDQAQHVFEYRDNVAIESLGSRNWTFRWTIPFRQGVARSPFEGLFLNVFPRFLDAVRDRTPGELYDPILGYYRAKVQSVDFQADPQRRDGVDLDITFIHAPEVGEVDLPGDGLSSVQGLRQTSATLDAAAGEVFRSEQRPPPEPTVNPLNAIAGVGQQITQQANRAQASLADFQSRVQRIEDSLVELERPDLAVAIRAARRLRANAERAKDRVTNPLGVIRRFTTNVAQPLGALAAALITTPDDLLRLNPTLASAPLVPANTTVTYEERAS
ncbi:MAG: DNA circularization N-terminal domain-containing protein [Myxococcota bacterium]